MRTSTETKLERLSWLEEPIGTIGKVYVFWV